LARFSIEGFPRRPGRIRPYLPWREKQLLKNKKSVLLVPDMSDWSVPPVLLI